MDIINFAVLSICASFICCDNKATLACSRRAQLLCLVSAANMDCTEPAVQTNRHTLSDKNHNDSKASKVVTDKSEEVLSSRGPKDTAAEKQAC